MGQEIFYCAQCGNRILEKDITQGRAVAVQHRHYCEDCRESAPPAPPEEASAPPAGDPGAEVPAPAADRGETPRPGTVAAGGAAGRGRTHRFAPGRGSGGGGPPTAVYIAVGAGVVLLLGVLLLGGGGGGDSDRTSDPGGGDPVRLAEEHERLHPKDYDRIYQMIETARAKGLTQDRLARIQKLLEKIEERRGREQKEQTRQTVVRELDAVERALKSGDVEEARRRLEAVAADAERFDDTGYRYANLKETVSRENRALPPEGINLTEDWGRHFIVFEGGAWDGANELHGCGLPAAGGKPNLVATKSDAFEDFELSFSLHLQKGSLMILPRFRGPRDASGPYDLAALEIGPGGTVDAPDDKTYEVTLTVRGRRWELGVRNREGSGDPARLSKPRAAGDLPTGAGRLAFGVRGESEVFLSKVTVRKIP